MLTVCGETLIWAFADHGWQIYAGAVIAALSVCITTTIRSNITKIVGPFEIGAVFSGTVCIKCTVERMNVMDIQGTESRNKVCRFC